MQSVLICMIIIGASGQLTRSQEVNSRAADPDEPRISAGPSSNSGLGGQARNIYGQKLSGHRMMHFGKKQVQAPAPDLVTQPNNQAMEVYPSPQAALQRNQGSGYPYALLAQTISDDQLKAILRRQQLMDIVSTLLEEVRLKECDEQKSAQRKQKRISESKQQVSPLRRMLQEDGDLVGFDFALHSRPLTEDGEEFFDLDRHRANEARMAQRSSNLVEAKSVNDEQVGEQQGQENGSINVESRSVPMQFGPDMPTSTKALISSILYGRQASQRNTPPPNYAKKYDSSRMKFMHFG